VPTPTHRTTPFLHRRPANRDPSPPVTSRIPPLPLPTEDEPVFPSLNIPAVTPFSPELTYPSSSSGTQEIVGRSSQIFLPEQTYLALQIPTRTRTENQAFLNHCRYLLGARPRKEIYHRLQELYNLTPTPGIFHGLLWRYKITITPHGVLEEYKEIFQRNDSPTHAQFLVANAVYSDWNNTGYNFFFTG
jgi:hypothetical protein